MSIRYDEAHRTFTLDTRRTSYQMQIGPHGHLLHLYYGRQLPDNCLDYLYLPLDIAFSPNPYAERRGRQVSLDVLPQEYACANTGDYRVPALEVSGDAGICGADLVYRSHSVSLGCRQPQGLPAARAQEGEAETLTIELDDAATGLVVELQYSVFEAGDVIARAAVLRNSGSQGLWLERAASASIDLPFGTWELLHFHGRHAMERMPERAKLAHEICTLSSRRGASGHQQNPFAVLCAPDATEDHGECLGMMLMYSGNFAIDVQLDQLDSVRAVIGIGPAQFRWRLEPGERFETPQVLFSYTAEGLTDLSRNYHRFLREHVIPPRWRDARRPVLLNSWEGCYYDVNSRRILEIARAAAEMGIEMFVLDDGWFGKRNDDNSSLGDWFVNEEKLPGGLAPLIAEIHAMGLQFGIWVEPEMVSEDSELYRAHPDWALTVPGRAPSMCRNQLVLDMANPAVVQYLGDTMSALLRTLKIDYVKWDMNRNMTDVYSGALPAERQGEVFHRYMLGVYALAERLTGEFPDVLFEGCSGGGGRFDAGMLYYFPQIWCSDDSDAIERLEIQRGTSFGYPISAMGAHVTACPNEQTGRITPLGTRAVVAMSGTFGYELDPGKLSQEEREAVREQIERFHRYRELLQRSDYYRLSDPTTTGRFAAWEFAAEDGSRALLNVVVTHTRLNLGGIHVRLRGLIPDAMYRLEETHFDGSRTAAEAPLPQGGISGASLMYAGYTLPRLGGDYASVQLLFVRR